MPSLPSLELLAAEVAAEVAAQERRGDALDSKAGIILGFAGVIGGLTVQNLHSALGDAGLVAAAAAALAAGVAFIPRSFPTIGVLHLRQRKRRAGVLGHAPDDAAARGDAMLVLEQDDTLSAS